jgi:hypothetical protein
MAIYGDQLAFFSEQFRKFEYFEMQPQLVSSYDNRTPLGDVKGVFQYMKRGELLRENDTLEDTNVPTLWTRQKLKVGNTFIKKDEEIYRIVNPADWLFEGGFCVYVLETFVGNMEGKQEPFEHVDIGQNSYA